jgi:hypothetical protein
MPSPKADLRVQVTDDEIIVTRPGSIYAVTYYKPENSPQLLAKRIADRNDARVAMGGLNLPRAGKLPMQRRASLGGLCRGRPRAGPLFLCR